MRKKVFRGKSMAEVIEIVKREMGKDAIIVSSRQVPLGPVWKVWQSPGIEVIAIAKGSDKDKRQAERQPQRDSPPSQAVGPKSPPKPAGVKPPAPPVEEKHPESPLEEPKPSPPVEDRQDAPPVEAPAESGPEAASAPFKKTPPTGSKAVSLRAFQAAIRRSSTPQKNEDPGEEPAVEITRDETTTPPPPAQPQPQAPEMSETDEPPQAEPPPETPLPEYPALDLDTPKPKLALDDFAQALNPAVRPEGKNAFADFLREKGFIPPLPEAEKGHPTPLPARQPPGPPPKPEARTPADLPGDLPAPSQKQKDIPPEAQKPESLPKPKARIRLSHPSSGLAAPQPPFGLPKTVESLRKHLIDQGVDDPIADTLARSCAESLSPQTLANIELVQDHIAKQMQGHLRLLSPSQTQSQRIIFAVGPSGAGKTSLIAKLAAQAMTARSLETVWISADTVRTGAIAEARVYADLIGIPLLLAYTPEELERTIRDCATYPLVLVDTPASNPWREASMVELGELLHSAPARSTYLTVPATCKDADLLQIQAGYGVFKINGLVFTKMDETRSLGSVFNLAWRSQIPLAYFTSGTRLLEDLHNAEAKTLIQAILGQHIGTG